MQGSPPFRGTGGRFLDSKSSLEAVESEGSGLDAVTDAKLGGCEEVTPDAGSEKRGWDDESASLVVNSEGVSLVSIAGVVG